MYRVGRCSLTVVAAACWLSVLPGERAFGQVLRGEAAFGGWRDDKPGVRRVHTPEDLPAISKPTYGTAQVVRMPAGARPQLPNGFSAATI